MSVLKLMEWLNGSAAANVMNGPEWAFPMVESLHFAGFALLIGTIAIVDLRLLGFGMRRQSASELATDLAPWTLAGLAIMLITSPLMFSADAVVYYFNPSFRFKMACLAVAIVHNFTVHRRVSRSGTSPRAGKVVAVFSLVLWTAVIAGGRMIAFV
jgi:hypothetical protein